MLSTPKRKIHCGWHSDGKEDGSDGKELSSDGKETYKESTEFFRPNDDDLMQTDPSDCGLHYVF